MSGENGGAQPAVELCAVAMVQPGAHVAADVLKELIACGECRRSTLAYSVWLCGACDAALRSPLEISAILAGRGPPTLIVAAGATDWIDTGSITHVVRAAPADAAAACTERGA